MVTPPHIFPASVPNVFKIAERVFVTEPFFSDVSGEISEFCNSVGNCIRCIAIFRKEISRNSRLTGVASLHSTGCNATKNKLVTKFLTDTLQISENFYFREKLCNRVLLE